MNLGAFHNDPELKFKYLDRLYQQRAAPEDVRFFISRESLGNPAFRIVYSHNSGHFERVLGIPQVIARLSDGICNQLSPGSAAVFPDNMLRAIRVGADLRLVWPELAIWLLAQIREMDGLPQSINLVAVRTSALFLQLLPEGRGDAAAGAGATLRAEASEHMERVEAIQPAHPKFQQLLWALKFMARSVWNPCANSAGLDARCVPMRLSEIMPDTFPGQLEEQFLKLLRTSPHTTGIERMD